MGPKPRPTSHLPSPEEIDCEYPLVEEIARIKHSTIARTEGTTRFIDIRFYVFFYWFSATKIDKNASNVK
jgi:hypothetical protein